MLSKYKNYGKVSTQVSHEYRNLWYAIRELPASERSEASKVIDRLTHDVTMKRIENNNLLSSNNIDTKQTCTGCSQCGFVGAHYCTGKKVQFLGDNMINTWKIK